MHRGPAVTLGRLIVRADVLADVTAEDPVGHGLVVALVDGASMLDRQIADAPRRVDRPGRDGVRGARLDTPRARAAGVRLTLRRRLQRQGRDHLAEQQIAAHARLDQQRVLAHGAEAGALGVLALQHGSGIDARAERLLGEHRRQFIAQRMEALADDDVVIVAARIAGNPAASAARRTVETVIAATVVVAVGHTDDGFRPRHQLAGIGAQLGVAGEVLHLAVAALLEPLGQLARVGGRLSRRHAGQGEAHLAAAIEDQSRCLLGCVHAGPHRAVA